MLENIYNQRITILNKLKRQDTATKTVDVWHKYVVDNAAWYTKSAVTATNSSVFIGSYINVLIPFNDNFLPYSEWKQSGMQDGKYTISIGDYVVLGDVEEDINSSNIVKILSEKYGENMCQVKHHTTAYNRFGARVQVQIEGV